MRDDQTTQTCALRGGRDGAHGRAGLGSDPDESDHRSGRARAGDHRPAVDASADPVAEGRCARPHDRERRPVARRGSRAQLAPARADRQDRHPSRARRGVSAPEQQGGDGPLGKAPRDGPVQGRVERAQRVHQARLHRAIRHPRAAGREADDETRERGRGALSGAHGSTVPARGHDLRRRPADQPGAGDRHRPRVREPRPRSSS